MLSLVLSALRERRAQTAALLLLTILAALGGSTAPWFSDWAHEAVASADIASAPLSQRLVKVTGSIRYAPGDPDPATRLRQLAGAALPIPDGETVVAVNLFSQVHRPGESQVEVAPTNVTLGYRENVCAYLVIAGACATEPGQVLLSRRVAANLGVHIGDQVVFAGLRLPKPVTLTVTGTYEVADVLSPYWASGPVSVGVAARPLDEAVYLSAPALLRLGADGFDLVYQLVLPPSALHDGGAPLRATLAAADRQLRATLSVRTTVDSLITRIRRDQSLVATGVNIAAVQLVLLCWFALYLAVRYTSAARRPDIGLLKLRGAAGWRVWSLTALQSAVPMVVGALAGWGLGRLAAMLLARQASVANSPDDLIISGLVAAGVGLGALAVCIGAESRALRSSVSTLLRRVPARRTGWRAEVGDLVVVVLALAGVYQGYADLRATGEPSVFALLAPGLVGLAVALVAARALPYLAAWSGAAALRAGRTGTALTALHVARRPGTQRVFAVVAVAVSVLTTTLFFQQTATDAWGRRAVAELGAARVLNVRAENSSVLLVAVRAADPSGRYAMAAARGTGANPSSQVLAVDSSRLAAVADLPAELGLPDGATLAQLLHPQAPRLARLTDGPLTLDAALALPTGPTLAASGTLPSSGRADGQSTAPPVQVGLHLVDPAGGWHEVMVGPLAPGRHTFEASVTGCPTGCRLAAVEPVTAAPQVTVDLFGLVQSGRPVLTADQFGDIARWRPPAGSGVVGTVLDVGDGRLSMALYAGIVPQFVRVDRRVFLAAVPTPVPVVIAGEVTDQTSRAGDSRLATLGAEQLPYTVVATGAVLPRLGPLGSIMDLEYAQLSVSGPSESVALEVWLTADAPSSIVDGLRSRGVQVLTEESITSTTDRLRSQGPGVALRFQLFAAFVLLLVAAGTVLVSSTVERRPRAEELAALRAQGLPDKTMRRAAYAGLVVLAGSAIGIGLVGALVAQVVVATSLPVFTDAWTLLPVREGPWAGQTLLAVAAAVVALGGAAVIGAARTVRAVRARRVNVGDES